MQFIKTAFNIKWAWSMGVPIKWAWSIGVPIKWAWSMGVPIKWAWSMGVPINWAWSMGVPIKWAWSMGAYQMGVVNGCAYQMGVVNGCAYQMGVVNGCTYQMGVVNGCAYQMGVVNGYAYRVTPDPACNKDVYLRFLTRRAFTSYSTRLTLGYRNGVTSKMSVVDGWLFGDPRCHECVFMILDIESFRLVSHMNTILLNFEKSEIFHRFR